MKTVTLLRTELLQNSVQWLAVAAACLVLGLVLRVALGIESQLSALTEVRDWNADLVVVPKGVTLKALEREILLGETSTLLPRALFETTQGLAQGQLELQAILPEKINGTPRLLAWGTPRLGTAWISDSRIARDQKSVKYATPEWGSSVIAAFFAKGSPQAMVSLKDLIDRKSVAQAFFLSEQIAEERLLKEKIDRALVLAVTVFTVLFTSLALVSFVWLRQSFSQIRGVLFEIGYARGHILRLQLLIACALIAIPALVGFLLAPGLDIH
jgi:hypothetical protein